MTRRAAVLVGGLLCTCVGCTADAPGPSQSPAPADTWVGAIATEGNRTIVDNQSGSVWGGQAMLVEEVSIGVESGEDPYMFGWVAGVAGTDERVYVLDGQVPALRVYDAAGAYLFDIGAPGQGPGEYEEPGSVALASDGRVVLRDDRARKISFYTPQGDYLDAYPMAGGLRSTTPLTLGPDDVPFAPVFVGLRQDDPHRVFDIAMQAHAEEGPAGEQLMVPIDETFTPMVVSDEMGSFQRPVPFSPQEVWALTPRAEMVFGVGNDYRFEVRRPDGTVLEVRKRWQPVPVSDEQREWRRRRTIAIMREFLPDWIWGDAPDIPDHKPAFDELIPTRSGALWVLRSGPGVPLADCDADAATPEQIDAYPCWRDTYIVDIFGPDGRFLGSVDAPEDMRFTPRPYIDGDLIIARAEDDNAVNSVKRYRLVRPD